MCLIFGMAGLPSLLECARLHRAWPQRYANGPKNASPGRRPRLDHPPAHHPDRVAGYVGGGVGAEEDAGVGDVRGAAEAPERDLLELRGVARWSLSKLGIPLGVAALGVD